MTVPVHFPLHGHPPRVASLDAPEVGSVSREFRIGLAGVNGHRVY